MKRNTKAYAVVCLFVAVGIASYLLFAESPKQHSGKLSSNDQSALMLNGVLIDTEPKYEADCNSILTQSINGDDLRNAFLDWVKNSYITSYSYRKLGIALEQLNVPAWVILEPIRKEFERNLTYPSPYFANMATTSLNIKESFEDTINKLEIEEFEQSISSFSINEQSFVVHYAGELKQFSKFGLFYLYLSSDKVGLDSTDAYIEARLRGGLPNLYDIIEFISMDLPKSLVESAVSDLEGETTFKIDSGFYKYGTFKNLLITAARSDRPEIVELLLQRGARYISSIDYLRSVEDSKTLYLPELLIRYDAGTHDPAVSELLSEVFAANASESSIYKEVKDLITIDYAELSDDSKSEIDLIIAEVFSHLIAKLYLEKSMVEINQSCSARTLQYQLANLDWFNVKSTAPGNQAGDFHSYDAETEFPFFAEQVLRFSPTIEYPTSDDTAFTSDTEDTGVPKDTISLDIDYEELLELAQLTKDGQHELVDKKIDDAEGDYRDKILFKLMVAVSSGNEKRFADLIPLLDQIPDFIVESIIMFESGLLAAKALEDSGYSFNRTFRTPPTNMLIESIEAGRFELFQFLLTRNIALVETEYSADAVDKALLRLAVREDWRFIDSLMKHAPTIRETHFQVIRQIEARKSKLASDLIEKYPVFSTL